MLFLNGVVQVIATAAILRETEGAQKKASLNPSSQGLSHYHHTLQNICSPPEEEKQNKKAILLFWFAKESNKLLEMMYFNIL